MMDALMEEAVQFCEEARIPWITLTPTPEIRMLERYYYTQAGMTNRVSWNGWKNIWKRRGESGNERG